MTLLETAPRDGLQNDSSRLEVEQKVELIARSVAAGARRVEAVSFVNPKAVPSMADAEEVMARVPRDSGVSYAGLVMNERGLDRLLAARVDEVNVVVVATDTFCLRNQGRTTSQALRTAEELVRRARGEGLLSTVTVAAAFGCPFEGEVQLAPLREVVERVAAAEPDEIALADTIGVGVPAQISERFAMVREVVGSEVPLRAHLHDTRATAVANAVAAVDAGVRTLDSSLGGLGGCPFAPSATGNVATEDLVYVLERSGVRTGMDLATLIDAARWLEEALAHGVPSSLLRAGPFPAPA